MATTIINGTPNPKLIRWTMSNGDLIQAPIQYKTLFENMYASSILPQITPDYEIKGGKTAEFRLNVLSSIVDYDDQNATYGKVDYFNLILNNPEKVGEVMPIWDRYNDFRMENYVNEKLIEWAKTISVYREEKFWDKVVKNTQIPASPYVIDFTKDEEVLAKEIISKIYDDVLTITQIKDKYHHKVPKNKIIVVVNAKVAKIVRTRLALISRNPELEKTGGVFPIGHFNDVNFYESTLLDFDQANYYVAVKTAWGSAFNRGEIYVTQISQKRDYYIGMDFQTAEDVFQPTLIIANKPSAPAPTIKTNKVEETEPTTDNVDVQETKTKKSSKQKNEPTTDNVDVQETKTE